MEIVMMNIDEIIPYENNPRKNDDAVEAVANSIKNFGFKSPIVVDANKVIVNGHTRLKASKLLGLTMVPVIIASDLTEEQCRALRLADNKTAEIASITMDLPAPVSPVSTLNPRSKEISACSITAIFSICRRLSIANPS